MNRTKKPNVCVALLGNPNTGKSTLFQALTGLRQRTGNYPGVTVEKKVGWLTGGETVFQIVDLPGTYSLAARSPDEMVAVDVLLGYQADVPEPNLLICIVDASNLQRNLFLVSQVLELERPTIVVLNMMDLAERRGISIDVQALSQGLQVPVIPVQAHRGIGIPQLIKAMSQALNAPPRHHRSPLPDEFQRTVTDLSRRWTSATRRWHPYLVQRLLLDGEGYLEQHPHVEIQPTMWEELRDARLRLAEQHHSLPAIEAMSRYQWIAETLRGKVHQQERSGRRMGEWLDRLATHRVWGSLLFLLVMLTLFQSIFTWSDPIMGWMEQGVDAVGSWVSSVLPEGPLASLCVDGVLAGFGSVVVFLPQIMILFGLLAILEDCGYLARAAYLMDWPMSRLGLSGKSFIPLLSSFACAVPGIMATRVIDNRRDRLLTILIAPLMSCSARLPVYTLMIETFVPEQRFGWGLMSWQGLVMFAAYGLGVVVAALAAWLIDRFLLRGEESLFVLELPSYKLPSFKIVCGRMWERGWSFVRRAGTLIVAVAVLVWAAAYYPRDPQVRERVLAEHSGSAQTVAEQELERQVAGAYLRQSYLGRAGQFLEPIFRPLGWDWRIGSAVIASFPAREVVIGVMSVLYNLGDDQDATSLALRSQLRRATWDGTNRPVFTLPVAMSLIVFFALCAQCAATLVVIRKETGSWQWAAFTFVYMTALAYLGAWLTYRTLSWWGL